MIEKWKEPPVRNGVCEALLTDLSKTFVCLPHSFLIAKLHAYGFDKTSTQSLKLLKLRVQRKTFPYGFRIIV